MDSQNAFMARQRIGSISLIDLFLIFLFAFVVFASIAQIPQALAFAQTGIRPGVKTAVDIFLRVFRDSSLLLCAILSVSICTLQPTCRSAQMVTLYVLFGFVLFNIAALINFSNFSALLGNFRVFLLFLLVPGVINCLKKRGFKTIQYLKIMILLYLVLQCVIGYYNLIFSEFLFSDLTLIGKKNSGAFANFNAFAASTAGAIMAGSVVVRFRPGGYFIWYLMLLVVLVLPLVLASGSRTGVVVVFIILLTHIKLFKKLRSAGVIGAFCLIPLLMVFLNSSSFTGRYTEGEATILTSNPGALSVADERRNKIIGRPSISQSSGKADYDSDELGRKNIWWSIARESDYVDLVIGKGFGGQSSATRSIVKSQLDDDIDGLDSINPHGFFVFLIANYGLPYSIFFLILLLNHYFRCVFIDPLIMLGILVLCIPYNFHEMVPGSVFALVTLELLRFEASVKNLKT